MGKIIFMGKTGVGKTTLIQNLRSETQHYKKTQTVEFYGHYIDAPGEYIENPRFYNTLITLSLNAGVFIDCPTRESGVAIVVAEAKLTKHKSMYKETVVGEFAFRHIEPAAVRTLELGMPTRDLRAITQEDQIVKQNVVPIKNEHETTIACLIVETDVYEKENENARMQILSETTEQLTETLMDTMNEKILMQPYLNDGIVIFGKNGLSQSLNWAEQA
ncbi:histidine kinase N-terminal domain-containing protein [Fusibacter ferrireducens]|uniref:Histidine kinase N-terminal domain-containing protein n=1 Tax=Fusibacter ferrireducens TaxID=2785058 RepID=A0ABS0A1E8_9FIRM|nr:histidine kinase N-terminal domain-containing protein [Fusibacter ferrireducens]MBF4696031.1 histidine kinase N-terminal domain-containing protein [Fusibacter ferrireducens]